MSITTYNTKLQNISMKDQISIERLAKLHPKCREIFRSFIEECETKLGITLRISQGLRTFAEQDTLYAQGRTVVGKIVTNAKGGQSFHNFGFAVDLVQIVKGAVNWNFDYSTLKPIAKTYGIDWGGDFKSIVDKPHFEKTFGLTVGVMRSMKTGADGYIIL